MNRSFDEMTRMSAGIMSPAESLIMSPGTSSCERDFARLAVADHRGRDA